MGERRTMSRVSLCGKCQEPVHDKDMVQWYWLDEAGVEHTDYFGHSWCPPEDTPPLKRWEPVENPACAMKTMRSEREGFIPCPVAAETYEVVGHEEIPLCGGHLALVRIPLT